MQISSYARQIDFEDHRPLVVIMHVCGGLCIYVHVYLCLHVCELMCVQVCMLLYIYRCKAQSLSSPLSIEAGFLAEPRACQFQLVYLARLPRVLVFL